MPEQMSTYVGAVGALPIFDCDALFKALDTQRRDRGLGWYELADELWHQSSDLNAQRTDDPLCGGAVSRLQVRGATSCQYALFMLRWLQRPPEDFLAVRSSTWAMSNCQTRELIPGFDGT